MLRHERPSEQAQRRPIQVARREPRPIHQSQKTAVRLPPLERQTVEQELVERVVDQRGVVGLGLLRLGVYHAIWRPEQNVEDTDLRAAPVPGVALRHRDRDRKSTRLNSSHTVISYAVFCLKKKKKTTINYAARARAPC